MANPTWPGGLPQKQFLRITMRTPDNTIRTRMDSGPDKIRRKGTTRPIPIDIPMLIDGDQRATFDIFYDTTLKAGSLPFDWEDPRDDAIVEYRFLRSTTWVLTDGDDTSTKRRWRGLLRLERMP